MVAVLMVLGGTASAAPGYLDPTFGSGGTLTTDFGFRDDGASALTLQPDGKLVAAGVSDASGNEDFALARYNVVSPPPPGHHHKHKGGHHHKKHHHGGNKHHKDN